MPEAVTYKYVKKYFRGIMIPDRYYHQKTFKRRWEQSKRAYKVI